MKGKTTKKGTFVILLDLRKKQNQNDLREFHFLAKWDVHYRRMYTTIVSYLLKSELYPLIETNCLQSHK